jgi:hypothetical protein
MLAKVVNDNQKDWPDHLDYLVFSYNACAHASTGLSPFFLMTGQQPKWNVDLLLDQPSLRTQYDSLPQYALDVVDKLANAYHVVRQNLHVAAERNRTWFDRKVKEKSFEPGQQVYVYIPKRTPGRCPKLQRMFNNVGTILEKCNDSLYKVTCRDWREDRYIHVDKLRAVHSADDLQRNFNAVNEPTPPRGS